MWQSPGYGALQGVVRWQLNREDFTEIDGIR